MCTLLGWTDQPESPTHVPHVRGGGVWLWCVVVVNGGQVDPMQNGTVWARAERNLTKNKEVQEDCVCRTVEEDVPLFFIQAATKCNLALESRYCSAYDVA